MSVAGCVRGAAAIEAPEPAAEPADSGAVRVPDEAATTDSTERGSPASSDDHTEARRAGRRPPSPPAANAASTCTVKVQISEAGSFSGRGVSRTGDDRAHREAWDEACRAMLDATGLDCRDTSRVRVSSLSSSTRLVLRDGRTDKEFEHAIELVTFREASGTSSAGASRQEACRLATEDACRAAMGQACPSTGVRLIEIDGTPTFDESWEPPRSKTPDRTTI